MAKVLDSWAVAAWVRGEPSAPKVRALLSAAETGTLDLIMSMVNVGEVYYLLAKQRARGEAEQFLDDVERVPVRIVGAPNDLILEAARWKSQYPISYADGFALATAVRERATLVTGDPDFRFLREAGIVDVEWIGEP